MNWERTEGKPPVTAINLVVLVKKFKFSPATSNQVLNFMVVQMETFRSLDLQDQRDIWRWLDSEMKYKFNNVNTCQLRVHTYVSIKLPWHRLLKSQYGIVSRTLCGEQWLALHRWHWGGLSQLLPITI